MTSAEWSSPDPAPLRAEARGENFPVASLLLARRVRPHVVAFYNFVRAADNVADDSGLAPADKLAALERFERALAEPLSPGAPAEARSLAASAARTGAGIEEARLLLDAFRQDATKWRYADHGELVDYCRRSADPVGRYLLRLHGEDEADFAASDALCTALQVLNHLQDCGEDYRRLDRVYLPLDLLERHGARVEDLARPHATPALRAALAELLARVEVDLTRAQELPSRLRYRRLRWEAAAILGNARGLCRLLCRRDPLATRVAQSASGKLLWALGGALGVLR